MPPPKRVPDAVVRETITAWRGNVSQAARVLGMSRKNLYDRLVRLGVDPTKAREAAPVVAPLPESSLPIRTAPRKRGPVRVLPTHEARLREAKFDLAARYRLDTDEAAILATFIEEAFPSWLAGKLAAKS